MAANSAAGAAQATANTAIANSATAQTTANTAVTASTANATSLNTLQTTVAGNTTAIQTAQTSINGIGATYTVKIDNNGTMSGFGLSSSLASGGAPTSQFIASVDQFAVIAPGRAAGTLGSVPFAVLTTAQTINGVAFTPGVYIDGNSINNGTVTGNAIAAGTITADKIVAATITAASGLIADAAITTAKIQDAAITTAKIGTAQITTALIGAAQITQALIANAAIGTAQIGNAQVNTLQIAGNAVTVPITASAAGTSISASIALDIAGSVTIFAVANNATTGNGSGTTIYLTLYRNGVAVKSVGTAIAFAYIQWPIPIIFTENLAAGTYTYSATYGGIASDMTISILGSKR